MACWTWWTWPTCLTRWTCKHGGHRVHGGHGGDGVQPTLLVLAALLHGVALRARLGEYLLTGLSRHLGILALFGNCRTVS